ncbi:MAG TPA: GspH/FimT family pseudopilin [Pseudomonadales bacterium]|nr:GspH/FimT family pseudopilin [Pseudomonadales bacterium]
MLNEAKMQAIRKQRGFTLVELMIVVTITAILLKLAVPAFQDVIRNNKVQTAANSLASAISAARSEAVKRGTYVSICPTTNNTSCTNSSTAWAGGWMVFVDSGATSDTDDTTTPTVGTVLLSGTTAPNLTTTETNSKSFLRFSSRGALTGARNFTVKPSTCSTGFTFYIVNVLAAGRPGVTTSKC